MIKATKATTSKIEKEKILKELETGKALIEYGNEFALSINTYNAYELDLFLSLLYSARKIVKDHMKISETENLFLQLPYGIISKTLQGSMSLDRIKKSLLKIFNTNIFFKKDDYIEVKHLFETLNYNERMSYVEFELKKEYIHYFFNLTGNFTQHEILEFTSLKGKYTKKIYQIIMAHKLLKKKEYPIELFRKILDIPTKYDWTDINDRIILQTKKEFENTNIENFDIEKIKEGRKVTKIIMYWDIKEPEIIKEEPNKKPKKEVKKEEIEDIKFVEPVELTPEEEERAIKKMLADGMDKNYIELMRKNSKTMFINMARELLKGVE